MGIPPEGRNTLAIRGNRLKLPSIPEQYRYQGMKRVQRTSNARSPKISTHLGI